MVVAGMLSAVQTIACGQEPVAAAGGDGASAGTTGGTPAVRPGDTPPPVVVNNSHTALRGSLYEDDSPAPMTVSADGVTSGSTESFISVDAPRPKKLRKNDVLTIIVQQDSNYTSTAQSQSEKQQDFDLALQQWIQLHSGANGIPNTATSVGSSGTLPEAKFKYDNNRQNQASQTRQDSLSYRIAATVVDVKPNGTLVLEAVAQLAVDREVQVFRLTGICRAEDITPDNTVLSTQLAGLSLSKNTKGEVHDGVKSGWLNGLIDKVNPF
jgi:flagellar L-ring protein precursor FlgH